MSKRLSPLDEMLGPSPGHARSMPILNDALRQTLGFVILAFCKILLCCYVCQRLFPKKYQRIIKKISEKVVQKFKELIFHQSLCCIG